MTDPERIEEALALLADAPERPWTWETVRAHRDRLYGKDWQRVDRQQRLICAAVNLLEPLDAALREAQAENERLRKERWGERGVMIDLQDRAEKAEREAIDWQAACEESQASEADLMAEVKQMRERILHVVNDSPGTPESVKQYLRAALAPADEAKR